MGPRVRYAEAPAELHDRRIGGPSPSISQQRQRHRKPRRNHLRSAQHGGLVARAYLLKYREVPPERVRMMYFFSTPTTGSDIASLVRLISNNPQLSDMRKMTTDDAGVLGVWEAQWSSSPYAKTTLSYCAYEVLPTMGIMVVQRESARHLCNTRPDPIARNHIEIVKPADNVNDESYVALRQAYRDTFAVHPGEAVWNLLRDDRSLLEVRNVTQTPYCENSCWSDHVVVAPGDMRLEMPNKEMIAGGHEVSVKLPGRLAADVTGTPGIAFGQ